MSGSEIHELTVAIRPTGASETEGALEGVSNQFESTTETAEDSAGVLDDFADEFKGAMNVIIAGLAVATAGLASQIPIIGGLAAGLFAIIESLALRIDSVLRPALQPVETALFDIAAAIDEAEGPIGTFIDVISTVGFVLGTLVGVIFTVGAVLGQLGFGSGGVAAVIFVFKILAGVVATIIGILSGPLVVAILAVIAAIGILVAAWSENWFNIRGIVSDAITAIIGFLANLTFDIFSIIDKLKAVFRTGFETMMALALSAVKAGANSILGTIEGLVNRAIRALNRLPNVNLGTVSLGRFDRQSFGDIAQQSGERLSRRFEAVDERSAQRRNTFAERIQRTTIVELDGREIARAVSEEQEGGTASRGRGTGAR